MGRGSLGRWAALALLPPAAVGLVLLLAAATCGGGQQPPSPTAAEARASHPALFFDEATFFEAVRAAESAPQPQGSVAGGIIPHHLLPGHLITGFFRGLAANNPPQTIVLIGPNHRNVGSARILTSDLPWETPFGLVEPDQKQIRALTDGGLVRIEDSILTTEHSVAGIMPAIKYYLPEARVVPIILSGDVSPTEARRLGGALAGQRSDGTVFVAAVDFSHDLVQSEAAHNDAVTLEALRAFDAATLFTLDNRYLDSAPSIAVLMAAMNTLGADQFVLLENTNSGALANDQFAPTTSYIVGYYRLDSSPSDAKADAAP